ncbi:DMT family transporter [Methylovirgula sp. 4M-Z18]|uniref:DMT family transporter n=1 Tax=Methylovirgula sp. 4M-Z18 TaxID=2293567 RepID=UPI000E2E5227|nr:DMT family transporter [Methylovirgula sp. 4M-Z18]RFB81329.1 DMT family transporter [Methylovirgula sp. 4M-Z18]
MKLASQRPFLLAVLGIGCLCIMDMLIKLMSAQYGTMQIAFMRYVFGSIGTVGLLAWRRPPWPSRQAMRSNALRSIIVVVTATTFFYALSALPLAETVTLSFLAPLFIALLSNFFLGERLDHRILIALVIGFLGMLVIVGGSLGGKSYEGPALFGALAALVSAFSYAASMVALRDRATKDAIETILFFQNTGPAIMLAIPALYTWTPITWPAFGLFLILGVLGLSGNTMLGLAYARAEAARLASLEYTSLLWASTLGFLVFHEVPSLMTVAGAALIIFGAMITSRR